MNPKKFRIVSLCPSTTLTMFDLGLGDSLVGRTKYCIYPKSEVEAVKAVGGTKNPDWQEIAELNPTHILFNMEENEADDLPKAQTICRTLIDTPVDIATTLTQLDHYAHEFGVAEAVAEWQRAIQNKTQALKLKEHKPFSYLYFIWHKPKMVAGAGTYIDALLKIAGGQNEAYKISDERYPELPADFDPQVDMVFLSSEPFHYKEKHIPAYQNYGDQVKLVDGEKLSWHGTYTLTGLDYLVDLFNSDSE